MELSYITEKLGFIGDSVADATAWIIVQISSLGINTTSTAAKIINLILFLLLLYIFVKLIEIVKKPLKYLIIALLILLIASTVLSFAI